VELVQAYSKRPDLADALVRAADQLHQARSGSRADVTRAWTTGGVGRPRRVRERLSEEDQARLVAAFRSGTAKWRLAERYGISESSVKRLLRSYQVTSPSLGK
jgi:hypothetical protein